MTKKKQFQNLAPKKLRDIWDKIAPADWLALLQEHKPDSAWALSGRTIKGCCPYHNEQRPSFVVSLDKQQAKCFGTCDRYIWNPIQFYADITSSSYSYALQDLQKRFNLRISKVYAQNAQKIEENDELKTALFRAMHLEFTEALINDSNPEYQYLHKAGFFSWLRNRKLPEETAHHWPVGVLPPRDRLAARMDETGNSALKKAVGSYLSDYLNIPGNDDRCQGWFAFFYYTSPTTIGRIKLRKPVDGKNVPYYFIEDEFASNFGWFGLNTFSHLRGRLQKHPLYVLEGEMDVLALVAHQEAEGFDDIFSIATSGKGEYDVTPAYEFGFSNIRAIPDNDVSGRSWAVALMEENEHVDRIFRWGKDPRIKDPDEAIRAWGFESTYDKLRDVSNYPRNYEWCAEQLEQDLLSIDDTDIKRRNDKAAYYGQSLQDDSERAAFLAEATQQPGIDKTAVIQLMMLTNNTPEAFVLRLAKQLEIEYRFMSETQKGTANISSAWSNRKYVTRTFNLGSESGIISTLELDVGNMDTYIRDNLGEPDFLKYRMGPKGNLMAYAPSAKLKQLTTICAQAVRILAAKAIPQERLKNIGQGIHYIDDYEGQPTLFIVNGSKFFKGIIEDDKISYGELDCPLSDEYIFRLQPNVWSQNIRSVEDINEGLKYDPAELFDKVLHIIDTGWRFKYQSIETQFVAADFLYTGIASIFKHMVMVDVSGETQSGKSSLMQLMGGEKYGAYQLCDSAIFIDDFTAAAVRQLMTGHCLRLLLDEFEDTDSMVARTDKKALAVRDVLNMIRSLVTGARSIRGTVGGTHQDFHIKFPLTVSGIYTMREARDLNRFVHIRMLHTKGLNDPIITIRGMYTPSEAQEIKRGLALCWLPRVPQLLQTYKEVQDEYADNATLPPGTDTRLKNNLMPAAAIMKFIGHDYQKFVVDFCVTKMEEMLEQGTTSESETIWSNILHTSVSLSNVEGSRTGVASIARIIGDPNLRHLLNDADLGAYYLPDKKWLVVFWQKIISGVLYRSNNYRGAQFPLRLKAVADNDPRVVPKEKIQQGTFMQDYVWPLVGTTIEPYEISVIDISKTLAVQKGSHVYDRSQDCDDVPAHLLEGEIE